MCRSIFIYIFFILLVALLSIFYLISWVPLLNIFSHMVILVCLSDCYYSRYDYIWSGDHFLNIYGKKPDQIPTCERSWVQIYFEPEEFELRMEFNRKYRNKILSVYYKKHKKVIDSVCIILIVYMVGSLVLLLFKMRFF